MELSKNYWIAKYYRWAHNSELPDNLCTFFQGSVLALLLAPFLTIYQITAGVFSKGDHPSFWGKCGIAFLEIVLLAIFAGVGHTAINDWGLDVSFWYSPLIGALLVAGSLAAILAVVLLFWGIDSFSRSIVAQIIWTRYKAFKGKYCPKITWK